MADPLLEVTGLYKSFDGATAVDNVSFTVSESETLGIVGESGSGKTTLARCVLRAIDPDQGIVRFRTYDGEWTKLHDKTDDELIPLRQQMQMVFQDPFSSLNPRMTVQEILEEPLIIHGIGDRSSRRVEVLDILAKVQLDQDSLTRYPHAFSGGQRQRIGIGTRRLGPGTDNQPARRPTGRIRAYLSVCGQRPLGCASHLRSHSCDAPGSSCGTGNCPGGFRKPQGGLHPFTAIGHPVPRSGQAAQSARPKITWALARPRTFTCRLLVWTW